MKVTQKKNCENVAFQKDFPVLEETNKVDILLTEEETKIGGVISKPVDYWYEIELNPYTNPQTLVGYDDDGAKIFKVFPEGRDLGPDTEPEDVPVVDAELSLTSERPVQNQAVTRAMTKLSEDVKAASGNNAEAIAKMEDEVEEAVNRTYSETDRLSREVVTLRSRVTSLAKLENGSTTADAELTDIRVGADGTVYENAGEAVRGQIGALKTGLNLLDERFTAEMSSMLEYSDNRFDKGNVMLGYAYYLNGRIMTSDSYYYTDYIYLADNTHVAVSRLFHIAFYDGDKLFVGGTAIASNALAVSGQCVEEDVVLNASDFSAVIKIPGNAKYMIASLRTTYIDVFHFNFGETLLEYDVYRESISKSYLGMRKTPSQIMSRLCNSEDTLNVYIVGDSQTAGSGGTGFSPNGTLIVNDKKRNETGYCWANLLKAHLESKYNCNCYNNGIAGISSGYVTGYITSIIPKTADICILMIGTNNRQSESYINRLYPDLQTIIQYCDNNGIDLILMIPFMLTAESEALNEYFVHMDTVAQNIQKVCDDNGFKPVDLYYFPKECCENKNMTMDQLLPDKIHPGDTFHEILYNEISKRIGLHLPVEGAFW